ncbi:MAG: HNH endonuclease [Syntrophomonas sp.]
MPQKSKKPCSYPGCPELVRGVRYCEKHQQQYEAREHQRHKDYKAERTDKDIQAIYTSKEWFKLRARKLKKNPICELCKRDKATMVDHIIEIKDGGAPFDIENLQSSCWSCHTIKTAEERRKRKGIQPPSYRCY